MKVINHYINFMRVEELKTNHIYKCLENSSIYTPITKSETAHLYLLNIETNIFDEYKIFNNCRFIEVDYQIEIMNCNR